MTRVSVVIVSNGRPAHLRSCLQSLRHQTYPEFEVVVVADALPPEFDGAVRYVPFQEENISAARNLGIAHAAGDILAFCDDDAIPDPPWLQTLLAPFDDPEVGATGGYTRGRNGISLQWGASRFDLRGEDVALDLPDDTARVFPPDPQQPVKLNGTNMAFRKVALDEIGGFDESFRFYLEDADAKLRLDRAGWKSALVPRAQVHHGYAASKRRTGQRVPTSLFEIGASKAWFCKKHYTGDISAALLAFKSAQATRLLHLMHKGRLQQADMERLMQDLLAGMEEGLTRAETGRHAAPAPQFRRFDTVDGPHVLLRAGWRQAKWADETARALLEAGCTVSVVRLFPSVRFFQVVFKDGYWQYSGGVWGKFNREQPVLQIASYARRFESLIGYVGKRAEIDVVASHKTGDFAPKHACLAPLKGRNVRVITSIGQHSGVANP